MAQDILLDFAAGPTAPDILSANLATSNASALTTSVDWGATAPAEFGFEIKLSTAASADAYCYLEVAWSHDDTDFSDTSNLDTVFAVKCTASSTVIAVGSYPVKARYCKFRLDNQSGGTVNDTGTALVLTDIAINQA